MNLLSPLEAFYATHLFVEHYFISTRSDSLGALLSCMHFLDDDQSADPLLWKDWLIITKNSELTIEEAFNAMAIFLNQYYKKSKSIHVKNMLHDISLVIKGEVGNKFVWDMWKESINKMY